MRFGLNWGQDRMRVQSKVADQALVRKRQAHIVSAATHLLLRQGFHKTSVREIAAAADVTMGGLYLYISRKEDLLYLIAESIMSELSQSLELIEDHGSPGETLRAGADRFFRAVDRMRREIKLLYRESASLLPEHLEALQQSELRERAFFSDVIREGIDRGEFAEIDPDLAAHDIIMLGHMWALKGWALKDSFSLDEYIDLQLGGILFPSLVGSRSSDDGRSAAGLPGAKTTAL